MNRKVRTHTAYARSSSKRNEDQGRQTLPKRPQTSLGFDRELSQINNLLSKDATRRKSKEVSDSPVRNPAFRALASRPRVPSLKDVLAKFDKYEEEWERKRALSSRPRASNRGKSPKNHVKLENNEDSLSQVKLKNFEKLGKNAKISKKAWVKLDDGKVSSQKNFMTKSSMGSLESKYNRFDKSNVDRDGSFSESKDKEKSSPESLLQAQSKKNKNFNLISTALLTVVEAEDIERHIENEETQKIPQSSHSTTLSPNQVLQREEDYDTELEDDFPPPTPEEYDATARKSYIDTCKMQGVVPVSFITKRLGSKELVMRHHGLGPDGTKPLAHALMKNTCVELLDLTDNDLQAGGCFAIALMLYENFYITDLDLSENFLHADGGLSLSKVLISNTSLKRLVLRGNHLTDRAAKGFADVLKENRTLLELDLSYNDIGESGGLFLGAGLALNYGLRRLNLSWNGIRNKGAVSMAAALKTNDSLHCLDLSWNGLAFVGALAFTRHLKKNDTLRELDISNNRINAKGAVRLSIAVAVNTGLQVLKIGLNPIGDEGVEAILNAAKKNFNIKFLGLEDITVSPKVHDEILELEQMRDIVILTGGRTGHAQEKPPPSGMEILIQFIQDNRLRLKDLFFQFDKDQSGDISREEFKVGLKETGIEMSEKQLDALIGSIDIDNSDTIEYSEILYGRDAVMKQRRFQRKVAVRTEQREKESIRLPKLKGFED